MKKLKDQTKEPDDNTLPNGMKKEIIVVVNSDPNLHLNIGGH